MKPSKPRTKENKQIVEIHIYIHQVPTHFTDGSGGIQSQACPYCGKYGAHTCITC